MARWVFLHGSIDASNRAEYLIEDREDYPDNTSVNFQTCICLSSTADGKGAAFSCSFCAVTPAIHHRATVPSPVMVRLHTRRASQGCRRLTRK